MKNKTNFEFLLKLLMYEFSLFVIIFNFHVKYNILTFMNINTEDLKKKIIYRASYRGTKEMDILLGSFTKKYINTINDNELKYLLDLLDLDDENLYKFNQGENIFINIEKNKVSDLFKGFIYEDE